MFDEKTFRRKVEDAGLSLNDVAVNLGISMPTLYRKMSGESDFYRSEIQKIGMLLGEESIVPIFFADEVA